MANTPHLLASKGQAHISTLRRLISHCEKFDVMTALPLFTSRNNSCSLMICSILCKYRYCCSCLDMGYHPTMTKMVARRHADYKNQCFQRRNHSLKAKLIVTLVLDISNSECPLHFPRFPSANCRLHTRGCLAELISLIRIFIVSTIF